MDLLQNMCHISEGFNPLIPLLTKTEFLPTISIQNQENKKREKGKYKFKGLLVDPLPNSQD